MADIYSGGIIEEIVCKHPDLGSFTFEAISNVDSEYCEGGVMSEDDDNLITASGTPIDKMNRQRGYFQVAVAAAMGDGTVKDLQTLQASTKPGTWTFTSINGNTYRIKGKPVGKLSGNGATSQVTLKVAGGQLSVI
jgi:hypothetical protein